MSAMSKKEAQKKSQDKTVQKKNREEDRAHVEKCIETLRGLLRGEWAGPRSVCGAWGHTCLQFRSLCNILRTADIITEISLDLSTAFQ
jgi:hypothetical protein